MSDQIDTQPSDASAFADITLIGELPPATIADKLEEMGDAEGAARFRQRATADEAEGLFGWGAPQPWEYTTHQFGYLALLTPGDADPRPILYAGNMQADASLKNSRINIHLDRLRVYDYPGGGEHSIMFTFSAQNQLAGTPEPVSFSQIYEAQEKQLAGVTGWPIFIGLNVGTLGVAFQVLTVNVKNKGDETLLGFLESPPFTNGLNLLNTVQPAIKPFAEMTLGLTKMVLERNRNVPVQKFYLGLDFAQAALGVRLAQGNYIAAQVPDEAAINWEDWVYSPNTGAIVHKADNTATLPFNYVVFRITQYEDP
jgi:hypothetical protein